MKTSLKLVVLSGGFTALGALITGLSFAEGISESEPLDYSGRLEAPDGTPLSGSHYIEVKLWNAGEEGEALCSTGSEPVELELGRFTLSLPDSCTTAVGTAADTWVEVLVNGSSLGRTKTGAVPYAVEANHAKTASAVGPLGASDIQRRVTAGAGLNMSGTTLSLRPPSRYNIGPGDTPSINVTAQACFLTTLNNASCSTSSLLGQNWSLLHVSGGGTCTWHCIPVE